MEAAVIAGWLLSTGGGAVGGGENARSEAHAVPAATVRRTLTDLGVFIVVFPKVVNLIRSIGCATQG
jgi:hypothetical protein